MYVGPMYVHAYSCLETLIQTFWLLFLCFIYLICLYSVIVFYIHVSASMFCSLFVLYMLD